MKQKTRTVSYTHLDVYKRQDGSSLGEPLGQAKEAGIPVISYDRLIMNSDAVTYYATFDNYKVGQKQGEYLVEALGLETATEPKNIELFTGDPADNNCNFFFGGAMDVLQKYIDEGKLVVKSYSQSGIPGSGHHCWHTADPPHSLLPPVPVSYTHLQPGGSPLS